MLKAGADLSGKTIADLISLDAKEFTLEDDLKIEIAQVNAVDINEVMEKQPELEAAIDAVIAEKNLGFIPICRNRYHQQRFHRPSSWQGSRPRKCSIQRFANE